MTILIIHYGNLILLCFINGMDKWFILEMSLYFLALINPASKIFFLSSLHKEKSAGEIARLSIKATIVAFCILMVLGIAGKFILGKIFHIDIYSLKIAGGIILFMVGLNAVRKGRFYEADPADKAEDISVVPLSAPLIAGPGTIAATISFSSQIGIPLTLISLTIALAVNLVFMLLSDKIGTFLERFHATGPIIRITGLIVAAVSVQMVLSGIGEWLTAVFSQVK